MNVELKTLGPADAAVLDHVADSLFDSPVSSLLTAEFLNDPRHHLVVALDAARVIGFVSAVHYVHPDKAPELWINEVSVATAYRRQGLARQLIEAMFALGKAHGCVEAWVGTERSNAAAMALYRSVGGQEPLPDPVYFTFALPDRASARSNPSLGIER